MNVAKFLICNLAFADFCLGFYLLMLAAADLYSSHSYYTWAIVWQTGGGCQVAGFLTMFGSVLSIFTLTFITVERWYAITYAIHLDKRVTMRVATRVMVLGWIAAIVMGLLPLVGVSSYSWTSICLPMDTTHPVDLGYVATTMIISVLAFGLICGCYIGMYCSVRHTDGAYGIEAKKNDAKVAKRMAILVFTDFACWFPIGLFGITAAFGHPLIDVTNSKILLVIFYPINSCANPFLYAIFTKTFHRDLVTTLARFGFCQAKAMQYRGTVYSNTASVAGRHSQSTMSSVHKVSTKCNHSHASLKSQCTSCSTPTSTRAMTKTSVPMTSLFKRPSSKNDQAVEINHTAIVNGTTKNVNPDGNQTKDTNDKEKAASKKKLSIVNETSEGTSAAEDSTVGKEPKEEPTVLPRESRAKTDSSDTQSEGCSSNSSSRESISEKLPPIPVEGDETITVSLPKTWI
uniref:Thyrotropin receptor n=1 Tax=Branchiostoma belcheri tsingtauense TaxID=155462 RepID=B9VS71_BRABE|nr:thyrotropin receptor [Branchiostoma belcheri tsingtauense]